MRYRLLVSLFAAVLPACATHDGTYAPDCIAYAGDRIKLQNGRFTWDKFTDQVRISDAGETVDPHPDYPVRGRYLLDGERMTFVPETDVDLPQRYLVERGHQYYLLTSEQFEALRDSGDLANCALILGEHP